MTDERDYGREMGETIDAFTPAGDHIAAEVAARVVEYCRSADPDLLDGWLRERSVAWLTVHIGHKRRAALKAIGRRNSRQTEFATAASAYEASLRAGQADGDAFAVFRERIVVNEDHVVRRIGAMRRADHLWVAGRHAERADASMQERLFHELIARHMPDDDVTTEEVFSATQYLAIRRQVFG